MNQHLFAFRLPPSSFFFFLDRKSTRLNSSHLVISYAVFCLKKKKYNLYPTTTSETSYHASSPFLTTASAFDHDLITAPILIDPYTSAVLSSVTSQHNVSLLL